MLSVIDITNNSSPAVCHHQNRARNLTVEEVMDRQTDVSHDKPVGDWISAPSPNFIAMATQVSPTTFWMVPLNRPSRKPPGRPKHLRSICHTSRLIGDFVQILRTKFWALVAQIKNRRTTFRTGAHRELTAKNGSIPSITKKEEAIWTFVTDRQTESIVDNNGLIS